MLCHVRDLRVPLYLLLTKLDVLVGQFMIKDTWTPYYNNLNFIIQNYEYSAKTTYFQ